MNELVQLALEVNNGHFESEIWRETAAAERDGIDTQHCSYAAAPHAAEGLFRVELNLIMHYLQLIKI